MVSREHQQLADALGVDPDDMGWEEMVEFVKGLEAQRIRLNAQLDRLRRSNAEDRVRRLRVALRAAGVTEELVSAIEWDTQP